MENEIYERDYQAQEDTAEIEMANAIFDRAMNGSFLRDYTAAMDAIPKVIVPKDKENYEYLLKRCDEVARRCGGHIKGMVDYHRWESRIELTLPFMELSLIHI